MTGINIHFGGIPFPRPYAFLWEAPDGRRLPTYVGEHYSLFSQFFYTHENDTKRMQEGIDEYIHRIEEADQWPYDFVCLTATNPPLYDNNPPDANLADLIRRYNEEGHEQTIKFITPEMLHERIIAAGVELPVHRGDWTDYWNFGSASTARELRISRQAKNLLRKSDFITSIASEKVTPREVEVRKCAYENAILYDEHTWNAAESITKPDREETYAQENHKKDFAYKSADLAAYLLSKRMESAAGNPLQSDCQQGLFLVNTTAFPMRTRLEVYDGTELDGRTLYAARAKNYLPYPRPELPMNFYGSVELPAFSSKSIPFKSLVKQDNQTAENCIISGNTIITPFYCVTLDSKNGRILQINVLSTGKNLVDGSSEWQLFEAINERIDTRNAENSRKTFFPRDVDLGNKSISQWQHDWPADRVGAAVERWEINQNSEEITITTYSDLRGTDQFEQRITFSAVHPRILMDAEFEKKPVRDPDGLYFAFPLQLDSDWDCVYDTADTFVHLDGEQLGTVCRDWITVEKTVSIFDKNGGVTLACPDAPLIQVGGFNFGKENRHIQRNQNPLLLAWPMNNYWDTNFVVAQPGHQQFHYELTPFTKFVESQAYALGMQAADSNVFGAKINCAIEEDIRLISGKWENSAPIFLRPIDGKDDLMMAVKNFSNNANECVVSLICGIESASIVDIQSNFVQSLKVESGSVNIPLLPNGITYVHMVKLI